jgi:hypothetical protein
LCDAGADQGIEITGFDAVTGEQSVAEISRRAVGVVADQQMIARLQHCEQGGGDRRQSRRRNSDAGTLRAFERDHRLLQRLGSRRSAAAILELAAMGMQIVRGRIQHGRAVNHRGIDEALLRLGVASRRHQRGFRVKRLRWSVILRKIHAFAATKNQLAQPR